MFCLTTIFAVDIVVNFFLAYHKKGKRKLETSLSKIRRRYLRKMFWVDLFALLPWDMIVMAGLHINAEDDAGPPGTSLLPSYVAILKWLTLLRMYRIVELFVRHLEYNMHIDQLFVTLIRNQTVSASCSGPMID